VTDYLRPQQRFSHLFKDEPRAREEREHLQALAERNIEYYDLRGTHDDPRDSEGADTVQRGGQRWA
jgi:pyruvate ferredoxin oxidoreductase beta subunit